MNILLPMNGDDTQEGSLVPIGEVKKWALVVLEEGKVVEIDFYDSREDIQEWIDAVVVVNDYEPVMSFIEEQVMVLVAHTQRSIDDIVEAFLFKELNDLAI
jgi:predicted Fe-Mo cluster-binding NifX family protein